MLVRRIAAEDKDAFTRLYDALLPEVSETIRGRLANASRADEIAAATFVEAWQEADLHTGPGTDVAAWIRGIAERRATEPDDPRRGAHPARSRHGAGVALGALLGRRPPRRAAGRRR
jgi:RNA polymerase sigma-70 factor (ECF subfamily)